jgi:hypothetical protein
MLRYVEPLSAASTPLADFFSIMLGGEVEFAKSASHLALPAFNR